MRQVMGWAARTRFARLAAASLAIGALAAPSAAGQTPGSFAPTGDMTVPRVNAVAAPLADGRVLVAGGVDPTQLDALTVLRSAEIFDPATGTFSPTGSMAIPRSGAAAAPLPDGRVLIAGGVDGVQGGNRTEVRSAEIFDPATGTFSPTGDMSVVREDPAAAPLPDGRVLVAGGQYYDRGSYLEKYLDSAEIFDPRTGTFSPTGSMTHPRSGAIAAAPLPDGGVLVAGGGWPFGHTAEIFDAATGEFAPTGDMTADRRTGAAAPLPDGRVLVVGGDGASWGYSAEVFDPVTGSFASTANTTTPRYDPVAAPLADGRVLVAGDPVGHGSRALEKPRSAELYTPDLSYRLRGTKLKVTVGVAGILTASAAKARPRASAAVKPRPSLRKTRRKGSSGQISLKLKPKGKAMRTLQRTGKLKIRVRLSFVPKRVWGKCVTRFSPCYSSNYAIHETRTLRLRVKKRTRSPHR
ncbi:MAG: hypothetical protein WBV53_08415 [Solirubrobacterales bacterium]